MMEGYTSESRLQLSERVRELRKQAGLTLREFGEKTGMSISALSKIENGVISAKFDTLMKLANGLDCEITALFIQGSKARLTGRRSVTKRGEGEIYDTDVYRYELLCADLAGKRMIPLTATLRASSVSEFGQLINHEGEEFVHVLAGSVELHTEFYSPVILRPGDSAYYDSTMGHALLRVGTREARVLWVCSAPVPLTGAKRPLRAGTQSSPRRKKKGRINGGSEP
jgi:transcriptional regulator with XRE-family HTH domain